jgi:F0F1-type ATP synthase epsilon subunit
MKNGPLLFLCGGLAEIDQNRVTVLVNDVEELTNIELSEAKRIRKSDFSSRKGNK